MAVGYRTATEETAVPESNEAFPPQQQGSMPGVESEMRPRPAYEDQSWPATGLLRGLTAIVTGGDSGIGRAVSVLFAQEGADIAVVYLNERDDAEETKAAVERYGRECLLVPADLSILSEAERAVEATVARFGSVEVLVNNAGMQFEQPDFASAKVPEIDRMVQSNLCSVLYLTHACLPHMRDGSSIVNSGSVTAYRGSDHLPVYSATKGAIISFTRSLALQLAPRIRVNAVAPGPVWTPLIPASFPPEKVESFGTDTPIGRAAQPCEIAPSYLFLASPRWSGYITGQTVHPNGGSPVNT